jgi:transposase-like protein
MAKALSIPLPRGWSRIVKSGLLHAIGLERLALMEMRAGFDSSADPRARLLAEVDRLRQEVALRDEEIRILRARVECIPARQRPHYPPAERLAILLLRAKTGWNAAETAPRFLLTPATIATWMRRLDEHGSEALVQTPLPVNAYDDNVTLLVHRLHQAAPKMGRRKLADVLARAGLNLAATTVRRMLARKLPTAPRPQPSLPKQKSKPDKPRVVTAQYPHHLWHVDVTTIAIGTSGSGFWVPWWPFALVLRWVLSWHIALVLDHFSRALVAFEVFRSEPTAAEMRALLARAVVRAGRAPRYIVTDKGSQFQSEYRDWCRTCGVRPRFGAVGKHGSMLHVSHCTPFVLSDATSAIG